jgi:hypothetical protein
VTSSPGPSKRRLRAEWPFALLGCVLLAATRYAACHRDASPYGNAWTEDHNGYCTNTGWDALMAGPGGESLRAVVLLAVTVAWPATALAIAALVATGRHDRLARRAWPAMTLAGAVLVVAFFVMWGHVTIVGGGGG